jgi:pimeloyl-ACP methyl ester carboxylesterase
MRRLARVAALFALLPLAVVLLGLAACQSRLIYPAPQYAPVMWERLPPSLAVLRYRTDQGEQVSFYQPPRDGGAPERLWLVCSGNGGCALAWHDLLRAAPDGKAGFLLLDYPGYGFSAGSCSPERILAASEAAVEALRVHLGLDRTDFHRRLGVLGHSLGAAAALQYAARHPVARIVLAAPFTSLAEAANHLLCWPAGWLVVHRFDNRARLAEIARQLPRPPVLIVHGEADTMLPVAFGRDLAAAWPDWVVLTTIPGVGHNDIAGDAVLRLTAP